MRTTVRMIVLLSGMLCLPLTLGQARETGDYLHYRLGMKYKADKQYDKAVEEFRKVLAEYPDNYNVYMHIAEIRVAQEQPKYAITNLKQALNYNPGWGKALRMLADAYVGDGQLQKAIVEYQRYQQVCDPAERDSIQTVLDRLVERVGVTGMDSAGKGSTGPATVIPADVPMSAGPVNPKAAAVFKRAVESGERGQYDTSLLLLREVLSIDPAFKGAYYFAGIARYHRGEFAKAKINFARAGDYREPAYAGAFYLGKLYGEEKRYAKAVDELERYVRYSNSEPGKKEARVLLAAYQRLKTVPAARKKSSVPAAEKARDTIVKAEEEPVVLEIRIDSLLSMVSVDTLSDAGQKLLAGIKEFQARNYDNAIREFKKTIAAYPTGPVAVQCLYNSGVCYCKLRLFREAENQFQQILERYGKHELAAQALFLKALTYSERKDVTSAEVAYRQFLQKYKVHSWRGKTWEKLGDIYTELEQPKKAIDAYSQAITSASNCPDLVSAHYKNGGRYLAVGNRTRAIASFDSAITRGERCKTDIRVPDAYYRIADEQYKAREYGRALDYYTRVVRKYPAFQETPWGLFQIGTIHKNRKKYKEAIDQYKDLISRFPEDYWAKQAQWKLDDAIWEHEYQATLR
ncbi:MAG: tetratricopeptide repeat protein [Chitinispirillaceae bacterium]|nr:tetratricopeptide repeat protein [Chitinispirillaceae bacterium]